MLPIVEILRFGRPVAFGFISLLIAVPLHAQSPATPGAPPAPTLELPVLIVDHEHRPVQDFRVDEFKIKVGAGASFAPLSMRRQDKDPLSISILIDASRDSYHDLSQLSDDFVALAGGMFLPSDRISLYAVDCVLVRSLNNAPPDANVLRKAVNEALDQPALHGAKKTSACNKSIHLWDDVATVIAGLSQLPGRRALLVISSGEDGASKYDRLTVQQYAFNQSVAIFGFRDQRQADADTFHKSSLSTTRSTGFENSIEPVPDVRSATNLDLLCANSGGLTLSATPMLRKDALADILFLIRSRFILTIPKDSYTTGTPHPVKVSLGLLTPYFISTTGPSKPIVLP